MTNRTFSSRDERTDIKACVEQGDFFVAWFRGQTVLYIPRIRSELISADRLTELVVEAYGKDVMSFGPDQFDYAHSTSIELPSHDGAARLRNEPDPRLERLKELIVAETTN